MKKIIFGLISLFIFCSWNKQTLVNKENKIHSTNEAYSIIDKGGVELEIQKEFIKDIANNSEKIEDLYKIKEFLLTNSDDILSDLSREDLDNFLKSKESLRKKIFNSSNFKALLKKLNPKRIFKRNEEAISREGKKTFNALFDSLFSTLSSVVAGSLSGNFFEVFFSNLLEKQSGNLSEIITDTSSSILSKILAHKTSSKNPDILKLFHILIAPNDNLLDKEGILYKLKVRRNLLFFLAKKENGFFAKTHDRAIIEQSLKYLEKSTEINYRHTTDSLAIKINFAATLLKRQEALKIMDENKSYLIKFLEQRKNPFELLANNHIRALVKNTGEEFDLRNIDEKTIDKLNYLISFFTIDMKLISPFKNASDIITLFLTKKAYYLHYLNEISKSATAHPMPFEEALGYLLEEQKQITSIKDPLGTEQEISMLMEKIVEIKQTTTPMSLRDLFSTIVNEHKFFKLKANKLIENKAYKECKLIISNKLHYLLALANDKKFMKEVVRKDKHNYIMIVIEGAYGEMKIEDFYKFLHN